MVARSNNFTPIVAPGSLRIGVSTEEQWIPLSRLYVPRGSDGGYQRSFNEKQALKIAMEFDEKLWRKPDVAARVGGQQYAVVDGQHRVAALNLLHPHEDPLVLCNVMQAGTIADEAKQFLGVNHYVRTTTAKDTFNAQIQSGDEHAIRLDRLVRAYGYTPKTDSGKQRDGQLSVSAMQSVLRNQKRGWELLEDVLRIVRESYGDNTAAVGNIIFTGLASFLATYRDDPVFDRRRLVEVLTKTSPNQITRDSRDLRGALHTSEYLAARKTILALYNNKLSKRRLPEA